MRQTGYGGDLAFECSSDKITVAPDQSTKARRVEPSNEIPNSERTILGPFNRMHAPRFVTSDATWTGAVLTVEEHQYVAIDHGPANGTALDVESGWFIS